MNKVISFDVKGSRKELQLFIRSQARVNLNGFASENYLTLPRCTETCLYDIGYFHPLMDTVHRNCNSLLQCTVRTDF